MFKIESYITSIILSNADKYIKNFRKQDAQVSLWEGDATFHNIDLNVDALNEELRSSFIFTSGYIHDLTIHVPWTKLISEPVIISINTIECVMRLRLTDEKFTNNSEKVFNLSNLSPDVEEKQIQEDTSSPPSYISLLTNKIMNNLLIRCKNVILKLVEEDSVFSMNIEELSFINVNELWIQAMTDINTDKLFVRKLITLSGVTVCLDKQNSFGRIDMYMEPLLYRCLINVRLLRCYDYSISKKSIYTHLDILSNKMSFTISEPQIPMLIKLSLIIFALNDDSSLSIPTEKKRTDSENTLSLSDLQNQVIEDTGKYSDTSWSEWLWSMVPTILPQNDSSFNYNQKKELNYPVHVGFFIKNLELNLKVLNNNKLKKSSKYECKHFIKCLFKGCMLVMNTNYSFWHNTHFGVNYICVEYLLKDCVSDNQNSSKAQIYESGVNNENTVENTLFDENIKFSFNSIYQKIFGENTESVSTNILLNSSLESDSDFFERNFSINYHLNVYTENYLLEMTPAFAVDYVKYSQKSSNIISETEVVETDCPYQFSNENIEFKSRDHKENILLRLVFGSGVIHVTSDAINRLVYLRNIVLNTEYLNHRTSLESNLETQIKILPDRVIQFTVFDFNIEAYSSVPYTIIDKCNRSIDNSQIPISFQNCPVLTLTCRCIDGKIQYKSANNDEILKSISVKAIDIACSLTKSNFKSCLLKCEKVNWENSSHLNNRTTKMCLETKKINFESSRENLMLAYYTCMYLMYSFQQSEYKNDYYLDIYFSSLINDSSLRDNTVLQILVESIILFYEKVDTMYVFNISMNNCKAYSCKLQNDILNRILIFNTAESNNESSNIHLKLQYYTDIENEKNIPFCVLFSLKNLKINLDVTFYSWMTYSPTPTARDKLQTISSREKEHLASKNGTSRKISDGSSSSYGRRYVYPKPKESVHSSSEAEINSPLELANTEQLDVFQFPNTSSTVQKTPNLIEYLTENVQLWCSLIIHGEISQITVFIPTSEMNYFEVHQDVEQAIKDSLYSNMNDECLGIFVFTMKSFKIKCDIPINIVEEFNSLTFIRAPANCWFPGKLTFPWIFSVSETGVGTLMKYCAYKPLLKPLSINCTVSMTIRESEKHEKIAALCVHFDFQPVFVSLGEKQVFLIISFINLLKFYGKILEGSKSINTEKNIKHLVVNNSVIKNKNLMKFSGWIQWTFTKCCFTLYSHDNSEYSKLFLETEDSIMSLEFDKTFYKIKLKISSFGIYHQIRYTEIDPWKNGPFYGVIVQQSYLQTVYSNKANAEEHSDRFLVATITSTRSSDLKSRLLLSNISEIPVNTEMESNNDNFITEIILKICSVDVIIPLIVIEKFLRILKPFMILSKKEAEYHSAVSSKKKDKPESMYLPFVYFDIPSSRIFIPVIQNVNDQLLLFDTFMWEILSVHVDCDPTNPIIRKQSLLNTYTTMEKKYANIEQKLQNQQYELNLTDISFSASLWSEIEEMLIKEHLSTKEPLSAFEQNPAVMWNQGCHPDTKNKFNLKHISSIISKFNLQILIAPSIQYYMLKRVYNTYYEISILSDIDVTISLHQIPLFISLCNQVKTTIQPYFKYIEKENDKTRCTPSTLIFQSRLVDSGIESMDQSSVESSAISKIKNVTSHCIHDARSKSSVRTTLKTTEMRNKPGTIIENEIYQEIYLAARKIKFTLCKTIANTDKNKEKSIFYKGLLFSKINLPFMRLCRTNNHLTSQISIFSISVQLLNEDLFTCRVPEPQCPETLLNVRTSNHDLYSQIKFPCYALKSSFNANKKLEVDVSIEQPVFINLTVDIISDLINLVNDCMEEYESFHKLFDIINQNQLDNDSYEEKNSGNFWDKIKNYLHVFSSCSLSTNRIFAVLNRSLLLIVDSVKINAESLYNLKNTYETLVVKSALKSVTFSFPKIDFSTLNDIICCEQNTQQMKNVMMYNSLMHDYVFPSMVLKPWTVNTELSLIWQPWKDLQKKNPCKYFIVDSDCIVCNINPNSLENLACVLNDYVSSFFPYNSNNTTDIITDDGCGGITIGDYYKDDLRAGSFQYMKCDHKCEFLSPYEIIFCNEQKCSFISWKYPQPRLINKLQIYPVPFENLETEVSSEQSGQVHCQLQYYDDIRRDFISYISFDLPRDTIQNVTLPSEKPFTVAADCWRIIVLKSNSVGNGANIDVKVLAGCVRVDSCYQCTSVSNLQLLMKISEIRVDFVSLNQYSNIMIENYSIDYIPNEHLFLSVICNDTNISMLNYENERTIRLSSVVKADILNYDCLMMNSFVDPFLLETIFYSTMDMTSKAAIKTKNIHLRVNPNLIHTLSVSYNLWNNWNSVKKFSTKITVPYIICNNTNYVIAIYQENNDEKGHLLLPLFCHLFAWMNPVSEKKLKITVISEKKNFVSEVINIRKVGCSTINCKSEDEESCTLFVSVIKHSSVVYQVVIYGSLLLYNLTQSEMDMYVMSLGENKLKNKLSHNCLITSTTVKKNQLLSVVIPSNHKLSFRIRYSSSLNDTQRSQSSGLIPLESSSKYSNQSSWLVKIPLKDYKEHFQSLWCQVTREKIEKYSKYLVVFRPLCSVTSFLPWTSFMNILSDIGSIIDTTVITGKGESVDLFIPDTVTLDRYAVEWKPSEDYTTGIRRLQFDKPVKSKTDLNEYSIHSLISEISIQNEDSDWPYLDLKNTEITWKTDKIYDIEPIIKISRKEENGYGTKIEIYPWVLFVNMLNHQILFSITNNIYTLEYHEVIAPPRIKSTFKLGITENDNTYLSSPLQLFDNEAFPIPKVMGRIPKNGFMTTMIDCDTYVIFANIASKNYKDMRIIKICSSYIISNKSNININYAAVVICRDRNKKSMLFDVPNDIKEISTYLRPARNEYLGQEITKWHKIGSGDVQVLPYLLLSIEGNIGCPVRICDLSEKEQYPIVFPSTSSNCNNPPCIFMTAQQNEGQIFLSIWNEKVPQITIHNMSKLSLNVISSKLENKMEGISYCPNWNWKFYICSRSSAHFHIHKQASQNNKKKVTDYLRFCVSSNKHIKQIKWSSGVPLLICTNKIITLPLSQHHIKLSIFKNGFTYVIWIESATMGELSAKMIRTRLSESFHPLSSEDDEPQTTENFKYDDDYNVPQKLLNFYNSGSIIPYKTNVFIEEISVTFGYDNEISLQENDIGTFCAQNLTVAIDSIHQPNEVNEDIRCHITIENYQFNNEEYYLRTFDFPIVLVSKTKCSDKYRNCRLCDLMLNEKTIEDNAIKIVVTFKNEKPLNFEIRDFEISVNPFDVYLEDKYLTKLKSSFESIFSAAIESCFLEIRYLKCSIKNDLSFIKYEIFESNYNLGKPNEKLNSDTQIVKPKSSSSKSVNVSEYDIADDKSFVSAIYCDSNVQNEENIQKSTYITDEEKERLECDENVAEQWNENQNYVNIPEHVYQLSRRIAKPIRIRSMIISSFNLNVSLHTSTTFYIALDSSPLHFSEFKIEYLVTTPFELGNLLMLHYFVGAIYGTGWAISSLEFVGSPGILARTLGTGIKDFVSMPIYGFASGPRGFVLGVAHGSASLMKHVMAGTLSSVTKFAGSWARTLDRFSLDGDDLLQCEEIRRIPPSNIVEGVLQGLSEFGISVLGGISGIAHHPLQYAVANTGNRSLINSISLAVVGVLTRPLSGAAELVAKTGQGILSHVGWNTIPMIQANYVNAKNSSNLQICNLKYQWNSKKGDYKNVLFTIDAVNAEDITSSLWIVLTSKYLYVTETTNKRQLHVFNLKNYEFVGCDYDPTLITILKPKLNYKNTEDFQEARILKYINETNRYFNIDCPYSKENSDYLNQIAAVFAFYINPRMKNFLINLILFIKNISE